MRQSAPAESLKKGNPASFCRDVRICAPAHHQPVVNRWARRNAIRLAKSQVPGFAQSGENLFAGTHEWKTTFESFRVEPGFAQSQNLPARTCAGNQDTGSSSKAPVHQGFFPFEKAAQIVLSRSVVPGLIKVLRRYGVEFVSTQAAQPETLVHCFRESYEAVKPAICMLEPLHPGFSNQANVLLDDAVRLCV